ncbi:TetR/AcrR family transcriptional regulator [Streptomonospora nanhaiensis]|uniref:AcrR family transcriptional regulator n=1 Tax=Streptomonospora nanhaiensis TaxID=1323731 RepID=A0A853BUK1_9ACTN|nr:TetR/AcrR family transcriptional regulator [Streptomonospora nanhaiensis]MBV2362739.1 TetR family transcriptional regulator [Streptomonospora nanhaiensis]MBX9389771.1 TetR family transcriptional regulator [Streptomonospora nanhaiensis]NYI97912.1 AcrR family transcriptional regulator [Streptomonospora nanhaiensis]
MPPANLRRRRALADAAIALLAQEGAHGLTHRAVETRAGVPAGTATNYFRRREAILIAAADRIAELHLAEMADVAHRVAASAQGPAAPHPRATGPEALVDMLTESLWTAATTLRDRYVAVFELQLEARRHPALATALARLSGTALADTTGLHGDLGTSLPQSAIRTLITLYAGTLFTLVVPPASAPDKAAVHTLAQAMVRGALAVGDQEETA